MKRLLIWRPSRPAGNGRTSCSKSFASEYPFWKPAAEPDWSHPDGTETDAPTPPWAMETLVASYQWLRQRADDFMASEPQYDMVIVDEAHRARFSEVGNANRRRPNQFLTLLQQLANAPKVCFCLPQRRCRFTRPSCTHCWNYWHPQAGALRTSGTFTIPKRLPRRGLALHGRTLPTALT